MLECAEYLPGNSTHTGCNRPYRETQRFDPFYTVLKNGNDSSQALKQEHQLQTKGEHVLKICHVRFGNTLI